MAHLSAKWLRHPCRLGDPHRCRAGGRFRSGPLVGKMATSPLPSRGSPPLQSGGGKSEVAHLWAKWLRHPCRLRDPHRCGAGGRIRSGPLVGKMAMSPLPSRGSPPLQSGGQNQKWPTSGQSGFVTPCRLGDPHRCRAGGGESEVAHLSAKWLRHLCRLGDPRRCRAGGGGDQKWPTCGQNGYVTSAVSGIPTAAERGGGSQKWTTCGQNGYVTPAVSGTPTAAERGAKSEVAHKWAKWLRHPCRLGDPHRCRAGGKIRSGPLVGEMATSPLPSRGSPPLQSGGENQKWPTSGQNGYVTPAVSGIPTAEERGGKSEVAHLWTKCLRHPCRLGDPHRCRTGGKIRSGRQVGKVAASPLLLGDPHRFKAGGKTRSGPLVGKVAMSPLPSWGSPPLQSGGQYQKWPTSGQSGYVTPAVSGIPTASNRGAKSEVAHTWAKWLCHPCRLGDPHRFKAGERGAKSEVAHLWAKWLCHPCRLGDPHRCRAGGKIRSGPQVGKMATSPLPSRGSPPLQSGGGNQKWPTCWRNGYVTPAVSGIPTAAERGGKSEVAHLWTRWLRHLCRLGDPHRCRAGAKIRSGPIVGEMDTSPLPSRGSPPLQSGGGNQKWPTCGQNGYVTPAISGIPTAAQRGAKSEVAHKWAKWLRHPCRLGDPHRCRAGGEIRSGPLVGEMATSPLPSRGSPPLQSGGGNQKWPTCGQSGYVTPAVSGIPTAAERRAVSEVAHKWAKWLRHPCPLADPHRFKAGGKIRSGPQVDKVATSPLPSRGSPPLQSGGQNQKWPTRGQSGYATPAVSGIPTASKRGSGGQNQKWPTSGQNGYVTPAVSGIPTAAERGGNSEVAHKWAKWLRHPCRLGDPHRCRAGGQIRSGPLVDKVATSPLSSRGSPPLQSWGGGESEVAHKWAKWLRHPCRLGDPHRCRAGGGGIISGPIVGEMATSPPAVSGIPTAAERGP